ncbi:Uncharacterized protein CTYZ_00002991 [Cryptosporidium tyzzeri]|nr:Uncharacterized protein CTYZ_00002991 [Cryptosporidium tyzzeri]
MRIAGIESNSITPLRQPFETFVTGNDGTYKSIDRWRSKHYSSNDDYLSPTFLDDSYSLSSSPIFYDETPNTTIGTPVTSPRKKSSSTRKVRVSIDSVLTNSNENTPTNNLNYKRPPSIGTPILTPPSAKTAVHDNEGFLIPDLPGTSRTRNFRSNHRNDISRSCNNYSSADPVHITMPPRLGLPSQTPLNMKDQYRKSPLPVVSANLDYRTVYMGDKLAARAKDLRRNYTVSLREASPFFRNNYDYDHSYSENPTIHEDDLILHRGEILRNKYSKLHKARPSTNCVASDQRSRSLSSYYSESASRKNFSPGYRSNSLYNNYRHSIFGNFRWNNKRRRLGSYIANQNDILQQHIQIIDKSLDRSSNGDFALFEGGMLDSPDSNKNCTHESSSPIKSRYINSQELNFNLEKRSVKAISSASNEAKSSNINSREANNSEAINYTTDNMKNLEVPSDSGKLTFKHFDSNEPDDPTQPNDQDVSFNSVFDSSQANEYGESDIQDLSVVVMSSSSKKRLPSAISNSSLDEIVPHPIPNSSEISNRDIYGAPNEIESFTNDDSHFNENKPDKSKNVKNKRIRADGQKKHARGKTINRRRHIDYHIPIDQVKPPPGIGTKPLSDEPSNFENSSRRYPKRLRTAPLKWYLGERLEYHRDEKNELGYTIAAIHKVANPKMLPNERGSIHPNSDVSTYPASCKPNTDELEFHKKNNRDVCSDKSKPRAENTNISKKVKSKVKRVSGNDQEKKSNAVILKDYETNEEFSMISVFDRNTLCWADVEYTAGKPYSVALSFISSQATCCEICLPPLTEKGLDESQDNYILGHVYMAPDSKSLQIMISDNNVYNIGVGDWFLIPDNTNYNFSNTSDHSEIYISLYVIKDS